MTSPIGWPSTSRSTIGDVMRLSGPGTVSVRSSAESVLPIASLQIVVNGEVVASTQETAPVRRLELEVEVAVDDDSWIAARTGGPNYWDGPSHRGPWERRIFAHTSPVYVAFGDGEWRRVDPEQDRRMLTLIEGGLERIRSGRRYREDRITHHHLESDHAAFLERPFLEALERMRERMS